MKRIEQIERMSARQLESEAMKMEVRVPQGLRADIEAQLAAQHFEQSRTEGRVRHSVSGSGTGQRRRKARRRGFAATAGCLAAAACLAAAGAFLLRGPALTDTFSDPRQAYAQVEMSFSMMQEKMSPGINRFKTEKQKFTETTNKLK
ncbi:MAG: hypothetical protein ACI3Y4_04775 [Candidatus Cryptobacteroides sp.]